MTRIVCCLWLSLTLAWHQLWPAVHCLLSHMHESCGSTVQKTISSVDANTVTPWLMAMIQLHQLWCMASNTARHKASGDQADELTTTEGRT